MKVDCFDVELLRFFQALIDTGALHRAASRLDMSQAAASRALQRLRALTGDPLFIKVGLGMVPTPHAIELRPQIDDVLFRLEALTAPTGFDPQNSDRIFCLEAADNGFVTILGPVLPEFLRQAPRARIEVRQPDSNLYQHLAEGSADLAIFPAGNLLPDFHYRPLFRSDFVFLVRREHPLTRLDHQPPKREEIDRYPRISLRYNWGLDVRSVEQRAETPLFDSEPAITTPYFIGAPMVLLNTDLVILLPRPTAERFAEWLPVTIVEAPATFNPFRPCLIWHHRVHADPAIRWFRGLFLATTYLKGTDAGPELDA